MSVNVPDIFVQQYSTKLDMLLQQKISHLRSKVSVGTHFGKQATPVDQIGKIEMQTVTSRFAPMGRVDASFDRRWVFPTDYDLPQQIDQFDKLRETVELSSAYVQNAFAAASRKFDTVILSCMLGTAKTGETGSTSTSFDSNNEVDVAVGGANSKLNLAKLREVKRLMMANDVDFERETVYIAIPADDHDALLGEIQITSADFNGGMPVLKEGRIMEYMGFRFVNSQIVETVCRGTNEVTIPVWCQSGVHLGIWGDVKNSISQRHDLQGEPWQLYTTMTIGATRLEEDKVYAIESYRST